MLDGEINLASICILCDVLSCTSTLCSLLLLISQTRQSFPGSAVIRATRRFGDKLGGLGDNIILTSVRQDVVVLNAVVIWIKDVTFCTCKCSYLDLMQFCHQRGFVRFWAHINVRQRVGIISIHVAIGQSSCVCLANRVSAASCCVCMLRCDSSRFWLVNE